MPLNLNLSGSTLWLYTTCIGYIEWSVRQSEQRRVYNVDGYFNRGTNNLLL